MGKIIHSIFLFSGKVGDKIAVIRNGKQHFRQLPKPTQNKPTKKQVEQRAKFGFATKFIHSLLPIIRLGYYVKHPKKSPHNSAMSHFLNFTISGEYPSYGVNFEKLQLAKGSVSLCSFTDVKIINNHIKFNWDDSDRKTLMNSYDSVYGNHQIILIGITEHLHTIYSINDYVRSNKTGKLPLTQITSGTKIHCYLFFIEKTHSQLPSDSLYLGSVTKS